MLANQFFPLPILGLNEARFKRAIATKKLEMLLNTWFAGKWISNPAKQKFWPVKNSRTRFAAFGVGMNSAAGWRSGEGAIMISVVMR
jgi:hypothetical protein